MPGTDRGLDGWKTIWFLEGVVADHTGKCCSALNFRPVQNARELGASLAQMLLDMGADKILNPNKTGVRFLWELIKESYTSSEQDREIRDWITVKGLECIKKQM